MTSPLRAASSRSAFDGSAFEATRDSSARFSVTTFSTLLISWPRSRETAATLRWRDASDIRSVMGSEAAGVNGRLAHVESRLTRTSGVTGDRCTDPPAAAALKPNSTLSPISCSPPDCKEFHYEWEIEELCNLPAKL